MSDSTTSVSSISPSDISSLLSKLGLSLNVVTILTTIIFVVLYLSMKQTFTEKPNLKWTLLGTTIAINTGNLINNINAALDASKNNQTVGVPLSFASLGAIGGVVGPILLTVLYK
jgi:hypothetical protein